MGEAVVVYGGGQVRPPKQDARVVELADSLDSGSSVHYARAGSSPASRTKEDTIDVVSSFFYPFPQRPPTGGLPIRKSFLFGARGGT